MKGECQEITDLCWGFQRELQGVLCSCCILYKYIFYNWGKIKMYLCIMFN